MRVIMWPSVAQWRAIGSFSVLEAHVLALSQDAIVLGTAIGSAGNEYLARSDDFHAITPNDHGSAFRNAHADHTRRSRLAHEHFARAATIRVRHHDHIRQERKAAVRLRGRNARAEYHGASGTAADDASSFQHRSDSPSRRRAPVDVRHARRASAGDPYASCRREGRCERGAICLYPISRVKQGATGVTKQALIVGKRRRIMCVVTHRGGYDDDAGVRATRKLHKSAPECCRCLGAAIQHERAAERADLRCNDRNASACKAACKACTGNNEPHGSP